MQFAAGVPRRPAKKSMNISTSGLLWLAAFGVAFSVAAWLLGMAYVLTD